MGGEFEFIERLRAGLPEPPVGQVWIGDDAAVLEGGLLVATDVLVSGVHFDLDWCTPADVGWKALAVNLSDIAAMGGAPTAAVASLVVPEHSPGLADGVGAGMTAASADLDCPLVGGDTTSGPILMVSVAVIGDARETGPVLRSGAGAGDTVFVTGHLGVAAAALDRLRAGRQPDEGAAGRLHRPEPRLVEGRCAAEAGATAMIDLSDGLAADLGHLAGASGVGAVVDAEAVPTATGVSLDRALTAGDDYELCFTARDEGRVLDGFTAAHLPQPTAIGEITESTELVLRDSTGVRALPSGSWEHEIG